VGNNRQGSKSIKKEGSGGCLGETRPKVKRVSKRGRGNVEKGPNKKGLDKKEFLTGKKPRPGGVGGERRPWEENFLLLNRKMEFGEEEASCSKHALGI